MDDVARIVDVMPTILDEVGAAAPRAVQGVSLRPLGDGRRLDLLAVAETYYPRYHYGWSDLQAIADGRYKLVAAPRRELYDLRDDPGETLDVAASNAARADALERGLRNLLGRLASREPQKAPQPMDPDAEERLRALGYVGGSVSPRNLEDKPRGDPEGQVDLPFAPTAAYRAAQDFCGRAAWTRRYRQGQRSRWPRIRTSSKVEHDARQSFMRRPGGHKDAVRA